MGAQALRTSSGLTGDFEQDFVRMQSMSPKEIQKEIKEAEERKKKQKISPQYQTVNESKMLKYQKDEDDFIDKTYQKYAKGHYPTTLKDHGFRGDSLNYKYSDFYKKNSDQALNWESLSSTVKFVKDNLNVVPAFFSAPFPENLKFAGEAFLQNLELRGPNDLDSSPVLKKSEIYYDKQKIADELLENSFYKYAVRGTSGYGKDYLNELIDERNRLKKLPYSSDTQGRINKLDSVIYMSRNYDETQKQFQQLVDTLYEERWKQKYLRK